jgi:hypothetical protein
MQENPIKEYEIHLLEMWNKSRSYAHSFLALSERTQESNLIIDQIHFNVKGDYLSNLFEFFNIAAKTCNADSLYKNIAKTLGVFDKVIMMSPFSVKTSTPSVDDYTGYLYQKGSLEEILPNWNRLYQFACDVAAQDFLYIRNMGVKSQNCRSPVYAALKAVGYEIQIPDNSIIRRGMESQMFDPLIKEFQQKKDERILYLLDKVL